MMLTLYVLYFGVFLQPYINYSLAAKCASFNFPTLQNSTLTAVQNETITLKFHLANVDCIQNKSVKITIRKRDRNRNRYGDICTIRQLDDNACNISSTRCWCQDGSDYQFKTIVDKADHTQWRWMTDNDLVQEKELNFNIIYPPTIHNLSINDVVDDSVFIAEPNSSVNVICQWENGNPPVTARLLDGHGVEMKSSIHTSGQVRNRFAGVGCQDAGLIRCQAPGSSHNKSVTLLVRCPPVLNLTASVPRLEPGGVTEFYLDVQSHTTDFEKCTIFKTSCSNGTNSLHQCNITSVLGTPPDLHLTLTVWFDNVTKENEGQWRLELANDVGMGHVDFSWTADLEDETRSENITSLSEIDADTSSLYAAVTGSALSVIIVAAVVMVILFKYGTRIFHRLRRPSVSVVIFRKEARQQALSVRASERVYTDIDEELIPDEIAPTASGGTEAKTTPSVSLAQAIRRLSSIRVSILTPRPRPRPTPRKKRRDASQDAA